jgi:hypothetical protein
MACCFAYTPKNIFVRVMASGAALATVDKVDGCMAAGGMSSAVAGGLNGSVAAAALKLACMPFGGAAARV